MNNLYQLQQITLDYGNGFCLGPIDLDIKQGEVTALVGPNGSGKTSLLNLLAFLGLPEKGKLLYQGKPVDRNNINTFKKTIGYIHQNPYLLRGSVIKNVELGLKLHHVDRTVRLRRVKEVMDLMNIASLEKRSVSELSGGEAQKVAVARVLVMEPEVLILDEPFTFLDKQSILDLERLIKQLRDEYGKTLMLTTHNQMQAQVLANQVYSLIKGKLFASQFMNLFSGCATENNSEFDTGKIVIKLPNADEETKRIAIDPKQIVISREKLESSMQNSYFGTIRAMTELDDQVKLVIDAGEEFEAVITHKAMRDMVLFIGQQVWVSFKSSSVQIC